MTAGPITAGAAAPETTLRESAGRAVPVRSLFEHVPHPHREHRAESGPPTVAQAVAEHPSLNLRIAAWGTKRFGSMPMFYAFVIYGALGAVFVAYQATLLYWSNWIQLWSLPLIMVGGIVLGIASDRQAKQQFQDVEAILHGQDQVAAHLSAQDDKILAALDAIAANTAITEAVRVAVAEAGSPGGSRRAADERMAPDSLPTVTDSRKLRDPKERM
jgi:hypothetical protein